MRRTVLSLTAPKRMVLTLSAVLLALIAAALMAFSASLAKAPAASAQTTTTEDPSFSVRCDFDHRNYDDPIVYPIDAQHPNGQQGAAHRHDFYGNKTTNYLSTYSTLTDPTAGTTCLNPDDKSAYWTPTLWWSGSIVKASRAVFYYRADDKNTAAVEPYPPGLKIVPNTHVTWRCEGLDNYTYTTTPPKQCKYGLGVRIIVPDCLAEDAQHNLMTDSADHRSHMAYSTPDNTGKYVCPPTHPRSVPQLQMVIKYPIPTSKGTVQLSSGDASTMHADFFNAWNQATLKDLVTDCINTLWPTGSKPAKCNQRTTTEVQTAQAALAGQADQAQVKQQKQEKQELLKEEAALKQRDQ